MGKRKRKKNIPVERVNNSTIDNSTVNDRSFSSFMGLLAAFCVLLGFLINRYALDEDVSVGVKEIKRSLRAWPDLPIMIDDNIGVPPKTPIFSKVPFAIRRERYSPGSYKASFLIRRLKRLITTCPDQGISISMLQALKNNKISYGISFMGVKASIGQNREKDKESGKWIRKYPVILRVNIHDIVDLSSSRKIREFWLTLIHEFQHYRQWIRRHPSVGISCNILWEMENDAYTRECVVAKRWGMQNLVQSFCSRILKKKTHKQALLRMMMASYRGGHYGGCAFEWAKFAGHPFPEAFR